MAIKKVEVEVHCKPDGETNLPNRKSELILQRQYDDADSAARAVAMTIN